MPVTNSSSSRYAAVLTIKYTIAITGKGGTGKTTIAASIIMSLINKGYKPVLAVDADPNACLDEVLGVEVKKTVGQIREESRKAGDNQPSGVSKRELVELRIGQSLVEADNFDLIAMGRPEGPGCYCYANNLFSDCIKELSGHYPFIVIDNEAGLENLSRRLYQNINLLIIVGDPSKRGIQTVRRLHDLAGEMGIVYERLAVVVNLVREGSLPDMTMIKELHPDYQLLLPFDAELAIAAEQGLSMQALSPANPVLAEIMKFITQLGLQEK
jgi:CO dehydrogenase maturation factor